MLFIFYLGLWNSQITTMKTISLVARLHIWWWMLTQSTRITTCAFCAPCNLLVLKEIFKNCGDCFLQGSGSGTAMMAFSLRALSSREMQSCNLMYSNVTTGSKEHYSSVCTHLTAGSVLGHWFYWAVLATQRGWKLLYITLERRGGGGKREK